VWLTSFDPAGVLEGDHTIHEPTKPGLLRPLLLIPVGLGLVGWAVFSLQPIAPPQAPPTVVAAPPQAVTPETESEPVARGPVVLYPVAPEKGDRIGVITLPTLDLRWPIIEGTDDEQLDDGVGHFPGSVLPGIRDNSVLSGHRTTVFGRLGELSVGDTILVETSGGAFTYQVREFRIVKKTDRTVIVPTSSAVLTLTTCYPFYSLIPTTEAFIVSADLIHSDHTPRVYHPVSDTWSVVAK
jgi:sortase A